MIYYTDGSSTRRMGSDEVRHMARTLSTAFMEHENWRSVLPDPGLRHRALYPLFRFMSTVIVRHGHVVVTRDDAGVAIAYTTFMENRDRRQMGFERILGTGALWPALRFLTALGPGELRQMSAFNRAINTFYRSYAADPTGLHLYNTGILPEFQGRGFMKRTFAYAEHLLKREGYTSYFLETTDSSNIPVYERFGLKRIGEVVMEGSDRLVWFFEKSLD